MTDDGVGKGPYFVTKESEDELGSRWWIVKGPGIGIPNTTATTDKDEAIVSASIRNSAYAEGRASVEKYTIEMLKFATDEVKKCHEQIRQLEEKYARNVYVMPPGKPSFDQEERK